MSYMKSQDAIEQDRKAKNKALGIALDANLAAVDGEIDSDVSMGSAQNTNQRQHPSSKSFLGEFKHTTAYIDLCEKLTRKDASVTFFSECLQLVE